MVKSTVMVAGKFDPLHNGHIDHIIKASSFGYLYIVTHTDEVLDKVKPKGHQVPLWARVATLKGILRQFNIEGEVVIAKDDDGSVVKTLASYHPDFFIKGGDRIASNMPEEELKVCRENNIRVIYGVGNLLNSSSGMIL